MPKLYPLFDELMRQVSERQEKLVDIKNLCSSINEIAQTHNPETTKEHYEEIDALIIHYYLSYYPNGNATVTPYGGRIMAGGRGILYGITDFPPLLQQIIMQYVINYS